MCLSVCINCVCHSDCQIYSIFFIFFMRAELLYLCSLDLVLEVLREFNFNLIHQVHALLYL